MNDALTSYKMDDAFTYYQKESLRLGFFERADQSPLHFFRGMRLEMNQEKGLGWAEMLQIDNGLYVGLCDYCLKENFESLHYRLVMPVQFNILLSGHFDLQLEGEPRQTIGPGDIWFGHSCQEQIVYSQSHNAAICGLSIGLPERLVESWLGNYGGETSRGLEQLLSGRLKVNASTHNIFPLVKGMRESTRLIRTAKALLLAEHQTIFGKLHFESLALELLAQLLTLGVERTCPKACRWSKNLSAVDMAVDILREEWATPPTISSLAKRVGTNECYLKKGFRDQIGMSIGQYIRELRMSRALELLETGRHTVMEVAIAVGYTNPSHFSAAFRKFYGKAPSRYFSEVS